MFFQIIWQLNKRISNNNLGSNYKINLKQRHHIIKTFSPLFQHSKNIFLSISSCNYLNIFASLIYDQIDIKTISQSKEFINFEIQQNKEMHFSTLSPFFFVNVFISLEISKFMICLLSVAVCDSTRLSDITVHSRHIHILWLMNALKALSRFMLMICCVQARAQDEAHQGLIYPLGY